MVAFLAALPAFIQSLPYMFQVALKFMSLVERIIAFAEKNNLKKWLSDVEDKIDALEKAQTADQKRDAARGIADLIRTIR